MKYICKGPEKVHQTSKTIVLATHLILLARALANMLISFGLTLSWSLSNYARAALLFCWLNLLFFFHYKKTSLLWWLDLLFGLKDILFLGTFIPLWLNNAPTFLMFKNLLIPSWARIVILAVSLLYLCMYGGLLQLFTTIYTLWFLYFFPSFFFFDWQTKLY